MQNISGLPRVYPNILFIRSSGHTINRVLQGVARKPKGGRRRSLLTMEEEVSIMKELEQKAVQGQIYSAQSVREHVEIKTKCKVSGDYLWDLFNRDGWKKENDKINDLQHCRVPQGCTPVSPCTGELYSLILPTCNTGTMPVF